MGERRWMRRNICNISEVHSFYSNIHNENLSSTLRVNAYPRHSFASFFLPYNIFPVNLLWLCIDVKFDVIFIEIMKAVEAGNMQVYTDAKNNKKIFSAFLRISAKCASWNMHNLENYSLLNYVLCQHMIEKSLLSKKA